MIPQKHTDELAKELPNLDLVQGYLVRKDADPNLPIQSRARERSSRRHVRLHASQRAATRCLVDGQARDCRRRRHKFHRSRQEEQHKEKRFQQ